MSSTESPPGPGNGGGPDRPNLSPAKLNDKHDDGRRLPFPVTIVKRLLLHVAPVFLFEVVEGRRSWYQVEVGDQAWKFALLFSAESKVERELRKHHGKGARIARHSQSTEPIDRPERRASDGNV
jgi:hypothetical protein